MRTTLISISGILLIAATILAFGMPSGGGNLTGTIVDRSSGQPIKDVVVLVDGTSCKVLTDSSGTFTIIDIPEGRYDVVFSHANYQIERVINVRIGSEEPLVLQGELTKRTSAMADTAFVDVTEWTPDVVEKDLTIGASEEVDKSGSSKSRHAGLKAAAGRGMLTLGGAGVSGFAPTPYLNPPNGQKYADMFHHDYGTNPFIDTEDDNLSTFGMDVSTGAYSLVRNYINNGSLPPKDAVRTEEFINYFRHDYMGRGPDEDVFSMHTQSGPSLISKNTRLVQIWLRGKEIRTEHRKPAVLTFVVDVSGSMNIENRLGLVKKTLHLMLKGLNSTDKIGIVAYGDDARIVLEHTGNRLKIEEAIDGLVSNGSTNAEAGLHVGYQLAARKIDPQAINRVILCTDGVANNGETSSEGLLKTIDKYRRQGITLTACGFGMGNYNDVLIEQLATKGDGTYYYIDDLNEARRVFVEQLTGTLQVIARDAKIQVTFDKDVVSRYRLIGYEKRDIADEDFRNDKVDGGEVGSGQAVMALYELKLKQNDAAMAGTISVRYKSPDGKEVNEKQFPILLNEPANENARAGFRFISAVVLYSEIMRDSYWVKRRELGEVRDILDGLSGGFRKSFSQYEDFEDIVRRTIKLKKTNDISYESSY